MSDTVTEVPPAHLRAAREVALHLHHMGNEPPADLHPASAPSFSRDQRRHADRTSIALENQRFGFVADVEPRHLAHMAHMAHRPTLLRLMVSDDGGTTAGIYTLRAPPAAVAVRLTRVLTRQASRARTLELITTFDDGQVLMTNNGQGVVTAHSWPAGIDVELMPRPTRPAALVARHAARVGELREASPHARPVPARDLPTIARLWSARSLVVNAHRQGIGYVTDDELRRVLGKHHDRLAGLVRRELEALANDPGGVPAA